MNLIDSIPFLSDLPVGQQAIAVIIAAPILVWLVLVIIRTIVLRFVMAPIRVYANKTHTDIDNRVINVIERPLRVLLIGIAIAIINILLPIDGDVGTFFNNLADALIIAAVFFFLYNLVDVIGVTSDNLQNLIGLHIEDRLLPFLRVVLKVLIIVMAILIILQEFDYNVTGLIASFGIVGLAFSLAAQDTAANVFGFTAIVGDNPFEVGDYIVTSDVSGTVERVGVRSTRIRKLDQSLVTMPNSMLTDAAVTNWSRLAKRRLDFYVGLTYRTNAEQMREILHRIREMLTARDVVDEESVIVRFVEFGDSALNVRVIAYILLADWGEFTAEQEAINLEIMEIVNDMGLGIAFPSTSLYIETLPQQDQTPTSTRPSTPSRRTQSTVAVDEAGKAEAKYQDNEAASSDVGDGDAK